ncbi:hypothetical protein MK435_02980 [Streptococcus oralis]|jgi:hypothetical protein|uniref:hypothetical protein n=1 Tax=Streptococcus oralis TaxID=1303 RepID=UPI000A53EE2A|nr:hypothetical protein [Streptococcus oralis]MCY7109838.1 hypothetical protein [Streptococcus oralis]
MNDDKMTVIQEMFKKGETDELVPAVPVILDGKIKDVVDILMEKKVMRDIQKPYLILSLKAFQQ